MTTGHGIPAAGSCSVAFDEAGVSAYGTAALARFFVAVEQPGPWGRDAATQSHLPAELGRALGQACGERGGRLTLLRRPGRHADDHAAHTHGASAADAGRITAYAAWAGATPWLLEARLDDPAVLLDLDYDALAEGDQDAVTASLRGASPAAPVLLVCTNGRRDVCCAVRGRPVALEASAQAPGRVWEASHTGGHRFAPTGVLLPFGATLARLDPTLCLDVLSRADTGELPERALGPLHDRGRSSLEPGAQVAESHLRHVLSETSLTALSTRPLAASDQLGLDASATTGTHTYLVTHRDGRSWQVQCTSVAQDPLPESCGKAPVPVKAWSVTVAASS